MYEMSTKYSVDFRSQYLIRVKNSKFYVKSTLIAYLYTPMCIQIKILQSQKYPWEICHVTSKLYLSRNFNEKQFQNC